MWARGVYWDCGLRLVIRPFLSAQGWCAPRLEGYYLASHLRVMITNRGSSRVCGEAENDQNGD